MMILTPTPRSHIVEIARKLLQQRLLNEKDTYQLFLGASDPFQKELALNLWQAHVEDAAELERTVKRYGGDLPARSTYNPFSDLLQTSFQDHIRKALQETGEAVMFYEDALKREWPIDVRMLLQKHQLRCKDSLRRLEAAFLPQQHAV